MERTQQSAMVRQVCLFTSVSALLWPWTIARAQEVTASSPPPGYEEVVERLRAAVQYEVAAKDLPALSIAVVERDRVIWSEGFGFQDANRTVPATRETVYRVGSVSKLFTDLAIMQLVEQGQLDLDAPVSKYLPSFAPANQQNTPITLRQLMSHRSGLVRESPVGNYFDPDEPSLKATVASLNDTALVYPPDSKTKYSNAGIAVVGAVLEEQLGMPYSQRIEQAILRPLGMHSSSFERTALVEKQLAAASMWTYDGRRFPAPSFALGTAPAGNLYSSVTDLSKFLVAIFHDGQGPNGPILKPETLRTMMSPRQEADGKPQGFAIGFHVEDLDGHRKLGHGGAVYGFSTQLEALPERKLGVAAVAALDASNGVVDRLAEYALRLMLAQQDGKPLPPYRTTVPVAPERAEKLLGTYQRDDQRAKVTELNDRVFLQRGVFRQEIRAAAEDGSLILDDPLGFGTTLNLDEDKLVIGGVAYQRSVDETPAEAPERWRGLIGEYGWDHNTLYVLEDHGRLVALIEWFYYYPLTELSENEFAFPDDGLYHGEKLKFTRDAAGQATQVVAAEVLFPRRAAGAREGETFKITPVRPIADLREAALTASPPREAGDFRDSDLVELTSLDATINLDIRYATSNNFTGTAFYKQPRALLQRPAAEAVVRAHQKLKERGLGLLIHDAYRPWHVTKMFWEATPDHLKDFVANPAKGSRHNRGCAVDLTLYELASGRPIQMVAGYDEFSPRSLPLYPGGTSRQRWYRELLRRALEAEGFTVYDFEWWHFDYQDWNRYPIGNATFEQLVSEDRPGALASGNGAADTPSFRVRACDDFEVSGRGDAPAWERAEWVVLNKRPGGEHDYTARVKMLHSPTGIYVLFDGTDQKLTATLAADYQNLWTEDVYECFFWTDERFPVYFEYEISPLGYELPILIPNFDGKFLGWRPWHYDGNRRTRKAVAVLGGEQKSQASVEGWRAEVFFPYELLKPLANVPPQPGTRWRANFYRMDYDAGQTTSWDWARVGPSFHEFRKFGTLVFE